MDQRLLFPVGQRRRESHDASVEPIQGYGHLKEGSDVEKLAGCHQGIVNKISVAFM